MITTKEKRAAFGEASANLNTNIINWQENYSKQLSTFKASASRQRHRIYYTLLLFLKIRNFRRKDDYLEIIQDVPKRLWQLLKGTEHENLIFRAVPLPAKLENGVICQSLLKLFGRNALLSVEGFILLSQNGHHVHLFEIIELKITKPAKRSKSRKSF